MECFLDHTYPNGWIKSRLYEVFLTHLDFGVSPETYAQDLEFIKVEESNSKKNCAWFWEEGGRLIVDLSFKVADLHLVITPRGFEFLRTSQGQKGLKIFVSYAREDITFARRLFEDLRKEGFEPWLDKENIRIGEDWRVAIENAIRASHYFVPLLSTRSVAKRGHFQQEIVIALETLETIPEGDIYIIPARLDRCRPSHSRLKKLNRIDLFPDWEQGFRRVLKELKTRG